MSKTQKSQTNGKPSKTLEWCVSKLYQPVDPRSIGVVRCLFGLMMVLDIPHERGFQDIVVRFENSQNCHFPLLNFIKPLPYEYMGFLYLIMWIGSFGIFLGYKFRLSCLLFVAPYWYIFLLDKTAWNNHSYLYGLVAMQLLFTSAHNSFSLDSIFDEAISGKPVPVWNYWIIRFQFFLLYFYAGLKKLDADWIGGHSVASLGTHWVFDPFRIFLTDSQIDFWIVHIFGFVFDLTVGFFLLWERSRPLAMVFSTSFHVMNSRIFRIGQFPYVCLVTTPIFCDYSWPENFKLSLKGSKVMPRKIITWREKSVTFLLGFYVFLQLFLPYSHSITKGYNNWTNGLYGYSWDMMVHSWDTTLISVTVHDRDTGEKHFIDPHAWVWNTRYSKHADMIVQYSECIRRNMAEYGKKENRLQNVSIFLDVWISLNGRFLQRFVDPRQDLVIAKWHPLRETKWILPLLKELTPWRPRLASIRNQVLNWHNFSDSLFVADFPGLEMEHYIQPELENITLTVLEGTVEVTRGKKSAISLHPGDRVKITSGRFHRVLTTSDHASCFVYTYLNASSRVMEKPRDDLKRYDFFNGWDVRVDNFRRSISTLWLCINKIAFNFGLLE